MEIRCTHQYDTITSLNNMLSAWNVFRKGKGTKEDVLMFQFRLMSNIVSLQQELLSKTYRHGPYLHFRISDPKTRDIHKASVKDRLVHHALYKVLYPLFDRTFIYDSYSCRKGKGTHRALRRFRYFSSWVCENSERACFILKCDIKKFFASIDHRILMEILRKHISDVDTLWLLERVIESFHSTAPGKGLPLGNLTSQLLVNVYMNEFDQWMKHEQKVTYYIRYADDFVILHHNKAYLEDLRGKIDIFLQEHLKLSLHPDKVFIKTLASGVDFLGWVHFTDHRVLRTSTRRRMLARCADNPSEATIASYQGLLKHGNGYKLSKEISSTT